jgi:NADPH-ferrihemoprotein reductase
MSSIHVAQLVSNSQPSVLDIILGYTFMALGLLATLSYLGKISQPAFLNLTLGKLTFVSQTKGSLHKSSKRCIVDHINEEDKDCIILFGSQTGNAQDFSEKLAKEGSTRFGLRTMVADLNDYGYESLFKFPAEKVAIFVLSSYGEGEPTDNAVEFYEFITEDCPPFSLGAHAEAPLQHMRYAAFGLGNSTYENFNTVARSVSASLQRHGARLVGDLGEGDDAQATTENSFITWKESLWEELGRAMALEERKSNFEPSFIITELQSPAETTYLGEGVGKKLMGARNHFIDFPGPNKPSIVTLLRSKELFRSPDRNCVHLELDLMGTGLSYQTGDHAAIWPINADCEVDRFLRVFGLWEKRHTSFSVSSAEPTIKIPLPKTTSYDTAVRYYLEIAGPISRQSLATLAEFASDKFQKDALLNLSKDPGHFHKIVTSQLLNLAQLIETIGPGNVICAVPFAVILECVKPLKPRYYSISSSSLIQKSSLSCTVVVDSVQLQGRDFKGVASNYLLALKNQQNKEQPDAQNLTCGLMGHLDKYNLNLAIHIRHSSFKPPADTSRPILMIGPGTGVAPFRAFVQERAAQFKAGHSVGNSILFFGCRKSSEDFIYQDEWQVRFFAAKFIRGSAVN